MSVNYQALLDKAWKINQGHYGGKSDYWNGYSQAVWDVKTMAESEQPKSDIPGIAPPRDGDLAINSPKEQAPVTCQCGAGYNEPHIDMGDGFTHIVVPKG